MKEMPKYKIIENYIIDRIQSGDLKPGIRSKLKNS